MHPVKAIALGLLAWPAAEVVAFFCVAAAVGFTNAMVLIVLMSVAGLLVLRHFSGDGIASAWGGPGMAPGLGGIFLLIPGFLTSALGIAILFPFSRRWLLTSFRRMLATERRPAARRDIVDLAPSEWQPLPGTKLPPARDEVEN
jgi:UPF0716 protein FxsA